MQKALSIDLIHKAPQGTANAVLIRAKLAGYVLFVINIVKC